MCSIRVCSRDDSVDRERAGHPPSVEGRLGLRLTVKRWSIQPFNDYLLGLVGFREGLLLPGQLHEGGSNLLQGL